MATNVAACAHATRSIKIILPDLIEPRKLVLPFLSLTIYCYMIHINHTHT